jgi:hypothetical protein
LHEIEEPGESAFLESTAERQIASPKRCIQGQSERNVPGITFIDAGAKPERLPPVLRWKQNRIVELRAVKVGLKNLGQATLRKPGCGEYPLLVFEEFHDDEVDRVKLVRGRDQRLPDPGVRLDQRGEKDVGIHDHARGRGHPHASS